MPDEHSGAVIYTPLKVKAISAKQIEVKAKAQRRQEPEAQRKHEALEQRTINRQVQNEAKYQGRSKQKQPPPPNQPQNNVVE
ncbi:hypothetical protein EV356DRAFT_506506, partial [Viridothelium virens]